MSTDIIQAPAINTNCASDYQNKAVELTKHVSELVILNQESYESAASLLKNVKTMASDIENARKLITKPLDQVKDAVMDLFRPIATRLDNSERHIKSLMISYTNEQERIRREQEEKLRKQAQAEEDRKRKALEERARKQQEAGNTEKAEELKQKATEVYVPAPVLASTVQKPAGISMRKIWKAYIMDDSKIPREYLMVDTSKLDKIAKATQGASSIPGVKFYSEDSIASR